MAHFVNEGPLERAAGHGTIGQVDPALKVAPSQSPGLRLIVFPHELLGAVPEIHRELPENGVRLFLLGLRPGGGSVDRLVVSDKAGGVDFHVGSRSGSGRCRG